MTDAAENMQEPLKQPPRQIDLIFEDGLLGADRRVAEDRYYAAQRWFNDWFHSKFNPDFYAVSGLTLKDENDLAADDRYLRVYWEIPIRARNLAYAVIIQDVPVSAYMRRFPIFNGTNEEKAALIRLLWLACDGMISGYEKMRAFR